MLLHPNRKHTQLQPRGAPARGQSLTEWGTEALHSSAPGAQQRTLAHHTTSQRLRGSLPRMVWLDVMTGATQPCLRSPCRYSQGTRLQRALRRGLLGGPAAQGLVRGMLVCLHGQSTAAGAAKYSAAKYACPLTHVCMHAWAVCQARVLGVPGGCMHDAAPVHMKAGMSLLMNILTA